MTALGGMVLAVNALGFAAMGFDKLLAIRGARRVREAHLLLIAASTGAPGVWLGLATWRHKTQKTSFRRRLLAATSVNLVWISLYVFV